MPGSECCNLALACPWSQLSTVNTILYFPSSQYIVLWLPHQPVHHLQASILAHPLLFCTPFIIYPFLLSCLFISEINALRCWTASLLIFICKIDWCGKLLGWTIGFVLSYICSTCRHLCNHAQNWLLNKLQHSTWSLLLPLGFLTLHQFGTFWILVLF